MYKWPYMLILSTFITASTCHLHLKITRTDADSNIIVQHSIVERVGSKLQLTCEIEGAWYDSYHKLAWGRRTNKLRFENVADLVKLAKNGSKQLLELHELDKVYMMNKAVKTYNPLKISDRGTYFCMSLKNELFQIVRIKVKEELKCQLGEFKCGNGEKCINRDEVCDKVSHCTDESDEEWHLCREKLCIGSIRCDDHCIPTSWCCDIRIDSSCPYIVRNKCCPPIDDIFIDDKDGVYDEIPSNPHLRITRTDEDSHVIVQHSIIERVGSKLQLSCEIERASYDSYKVVWGRRTNELRFENVADLVKLAKNGSKQLLELDQLDSPYTLNRAIKTFNPLTMSDRGTYFCMNLKNELFQIVGIKVKNELKCQLEQFKCGNGEKCIEQYELCDKIHQCTDGSDEEWKLCKKKQCIGVKKDDINSIDVMDTNKHVLPPKPLTLADKVILTIATACVVLTVSLIIYYVMKERNARNSHNSNNRNGTPVPPIIRTDDDDNSSMRFATEIGIGNSNSTRNTPINSPASSCRSSLQDILTTIDYHATLPPTYNEALANLKSSNLSLSDQLESSKSIFLDVPNITPGTSRDDNE